MGDQAPAGWYPDPGGSGGQRWWDGDQWTDALQPSPGQGAMPPPGPPMAPSSASAAESPTHHLFGGKRRLQDENQRLAATIADLGIPERDALRAEIARLSSELPRLKGEESDLLSRVEPLRQEVGQLEPEHQKLEAVRAVVADLERQQASLMAALAEATSLIAERDLIKAELNDLKAQVVETRDAAILQEVGIYQYRHPLDDAPAFKERLARTQQLIKEAAKSGSAIKAATTWTVNGSTREGSKMVREMSKLMLRAYNNEADNAVRSMRPYTLDSSLARLNKARDVISRLGGTMQIRVTDAYHQLRTIELELTSDYLAKVAEDKERAREERARLREEEIARREIAREQERLRKEYEHYTNNAAALEAKGDTTGALAAQQKLGEIADAIEGLTQRAANVRAGHVYVVSNVGSFGPDLVKIGMTRRLDPMERIHELGDASVPFRYDLHALIFSDDAVSLETRLHHQFRDQRVNWVNLRREFFRAHPNQVREFLDSIGATPLSYVEEPEAIEWRQTETARRAGAHAPEPHHHLAPFELQDADEGVAPS